MQMPVIGITAAAVAALLSGALVNSYPAGGETQPNEQALAYTNQLLPQNPSPLLSEPCPSCPGNGVCQGCNGTGLTQGEKPCSECDNGIAPVSSGACPHCENG
jgi:hypothetical protein